MPILDPDGIGKRTGINGDFGDRALGPARIEYRFKSRPTGMMRRIGIRRRDMSADPLGPCLEVANTGGRADDADPHFGRMRAIFGRSEQEQAIFGMLHALLIAKAE